MLNNVSFIRKSIYKLNVLVVDSRWHTLKRKVIKRLFAINVTIRIVFTIVIDFT